MKTALQSTSPRDRGLHGGVSKKRPKRPYDSYFSDSTEIDRVEFVATNCGSPLANRQLNQAKQIYAYMMYIRNKKQKQKRIPALYIYIYTWNHIRRPIMSLDWHPL
jgi:hypothetical protein